MHEIHPASLELSFSIEENQIMTAGNQAAQKRKMFLGGAIDPISGKRTDSDIIYDADNLTTHGIIVGMTGSGKTGLGIVMLEEALAIGIPCLILDPKGDMGNLLLNFPSFSPENFLPWINESEVKSSGIDLDQQAIQISANWRSGLEGWGIGKERMQKLAASAGYAIYTPGSVSGIPINVVGSLIAPRLDWSQPSQAEIARDEIEGLVSSLLVLARVEDDPISSPEHILLANHLLLDNNPHGSTVQHCKRCSSELCLRYRWQISRTIHQCRHFRNKFQWIDCCSFYDRFTHFFTRTTDCCSYLL